MASSSTLPSSSPSAAVSSPPPSLSAIYKKHKVKIEGQRAENDRLARNVVESVGVVAHEMVNSVNSGVANVFAKQKALEEQARLLEDHTKSLTNQSKQWISLLGSFNNALKELGDVESWAHTIESDMRDVAATLLFLQANAGASS
eukprot:TRINITY_DN3502_c0_g1_i1.p1 TRINITY_DN3502_c0_g1~~TRINITY_DN3502_c0_g1_i1.p1  ORF type:complete len:145 (+),score=39.42 TRINITY_DN3502_c0_g1_i1:24-458(+)